MRMQLQQDDPMADVMINADRSAGPGQWRTLQSAGHPGDVLQSAANPRRTGTSGYFFVISQVLGAVGWGQWLAEGVATAGLILVILRSPPGKAPALIACYIGAAYWFTASTSFANPAAVLGRMLSDSFAGIAPVSAPGFVIAEAIGAGAGVLLSGWLDEAKEANRS